MNELVGDETEETERRTDERVERTNETNERCAAQDHVKFQFLLRAVAFSLRGLLFLNFRAKLANTK